MTVDQKKLVSNKQNKFVSLAQLPTWKVLVIIFLLALCLRVMFLGSKSIWLDEAWGLGVTKAGQSALWSGSSEDHHPPLFHLMHGYWIKLGENEFNLRLLSAIFGALSAILIYRLGKDLLGKKAALTGVWLSTLSPLLIWYSQEARSYIFLVFIGLTASTAAVNLFLRPNLFWLFLFIVAMAAAIYTHYAAFLLIPIQLVLLAALIATRRSRKSAIIFWLIGWIITIAAYWPWLQSPAAKAFLRKLKTGSYPAQIFSDRFNIEPTRLMSILAVCIPIAISIVLFLVYRLFQKQDNIWMRLRSQKWFQRLLALIFIILLVASVVPRGYTLKKQTIILWPFILLSFCWFWPWKQSYQKLLIFILALSLLASLTNICLIPKDQWRETVNYITKQSQKKDVVLLLPSYMTYPFDYYNQGRLARYGVNSSIDSSQLESFANNYERIWLVSNQADIADPEEKIENWLKQHTTRVETKSFYRIQVYLYQK